jgi:hypothetical protein
MAAADRAGTTRSTATMPESAWRPQSLERGRASAC